MKTVIETPMFHPMPANMLLVATNFIMLSWALVDHARLADHDVMICFHGDIQRKSRQSSSACMMQGRNSLSLFSVNSGDQSVEDG